MNTYDFEVKKIIDNLKIPQNMDNPNYISESIIKLSALNYELGVAMADAELKENEAITGLLAMPLEEGEKKITLGEAEKRGLVNTKNIYGLLKNQSYGVVELINTLKKRLDVLSWEFIQAKQ